MTIDIHRALIEGVKNENLLRLRLNELKYYKKIGLTKLSEIKKFNKFKNHRRRKVSEMLFTYFLKEIVLYLASLLLFLLFLETANTQSGYCKFLES